jgi:hypothetical protein
MLDSNTIQTFDRNRRRFYRGYVFSFGLFCIVCIVRAICKSFGPLPSWLDSTLFVSLMATVILQLYFLIMLSQMKKKAMHDPALKEVLADELTQYHQMKAWKYAFLSTIGCLFLITIVSIFVPIHETITIVTPAFLTGAGAYHFSFWWMEKE